jgi:glycosyltransferase involved in cell wall biosynthesis
VQVTLATFDSAEGDFYPLAETIARRSYNDESSGQKKILHSSIQRTRWLRRVMQQTRPDTVISFTDRTNVLTLLAAQGLDIPVIVSERVDPTMYDPGRAWRIGRRLTYPTATAIVVQTGEIEQWARLHFPRTRAVIIPNPAPVSVPPGDRTPIPQIIAAGRLTRQKGFDLLLDAFSHVASRWPEWNLKILGEGEARPELEARIRQLGLVDRVTLAGQRSDALDQIAASSIFVLSSRFEGFPNVLVEAMSTGRAVVSTDCRSGPADLVDHGINGLLVPPEDVSALTSAMEQLMANPADRIRLGSSARTIHERLSLKNILDQWNRLIQECCSQIPLPHAA